jgi:cobalamin biosynthetic protein CobC
MRVTSPFADPFALPTHGGDLASAESRFGKPQDGWLDLSTGINPFAYPLPELDSSLWRLLPGTELEKGLLTAAAAAYGVAEPGQLVMAPGSQSVIQALPRLRPFSHVAVVGPTYGEHASSWISAGHQLLPCETLDRIGDAEVVVVANPNNPDGRRHDPLRLLEIADRLAPRGGLVVVDEAFADTVPELSLAGQVRPGLLVLRSFGKFFGLAGVRLGFAITDPPLARILRSAFGPWSVSGPALAIGTVALADRRWMSEMRRRLAGEAAALDGVLTRGQLSVVGGTHLFRLVNAPRAWALYEHLGQRGILVRPFVSSPRWLRFGLPAGEDQARRLSQALEQFQAG